MRAPHKQTMTKCACDSREPQMVENGSKESMVQKLGLALVGEEWGRTHTCPRRTGDTCRVSLSPTMPACIATMDQRLFDLHPLKLLGLGPRNDFDSAKPPPLP